MSSLIPTLWNDQNSPVFSLQKEMDKLFEDFGRKLPAGSPFGNFPSINVAETETGLELTAELPGVAEKDIDVSVSDRTLTLKGEKHEEKTVNEKDRHVSERSFGSFRRVMTLPFAPKKEGIEAHMENGVLTVTLPRPEDAGPQPHKIEVKRKS
ncbi:Hsp20/alpha crystallin family protein [Labrenzia sp. 011]|uniref:Hsp20/alpha crystallin family protein n=1 Tax=Labrenzia sp. 011 TaxID=2171494 RepID=UPI000D50FBAA|nr:Hsp20/alpha crystallin family protein [Labrenzia sp. 011]PVB63146.1 heat-shock protein [Labrenzia sp. 011]